MIEHAVVIAGGGPTGLMLAGELALAGVDVAIVERRATQDLPGSRAGGLHSRTIEVLDQRGIADRFLAEGQVAQVAGFAGVSFDISDFPTRHPYGLGLWQKHIERILAGWVDELPVTFYRGARRDGLRAGRQRRRCRVVRRPVAAGASISSGATADAVWSARLPGSSSPAGIRRRAACSPRSRWPRSRNWASAARPRARMPWARSSTRSRTARWSTQPGGTVGVMLTESAGRHERAHPARSQRGPHRRLRDRLRDPQPHLDHQVHRHDPAGRHLPRGTGPAGRRRGARALPGRWTGPQHRCAGCGESGLEAGPGGQADIAGKPPGHLPRRAPPGRRPRAARHDDAGRAHARRRSHRSSARHRVRVAEHGRAAHAIRREDVRPRHPLRPRRGPPAARAPHARSRPGHRRRPAAGLHAAARCPAGAARPRPARRPGHHSLGGPSVSDRRRLRRRVGASGPGPSRRPRLPC